jgi:CBS domain containing-hemolysin-like protein
MSPTDVGLLILAAVLVFVAGLFACVETALSSVSRARAEDLERDGRAGAARLTSVLSDLPRFVNTALLLRVAFEATGLVIVARVAIDVLEPTWLEILVAAGAMTVVSYIAVGVGPQTLGRQHPERVALISAAPIKALTAVLGPIPQLLIFVGNVLTPGKGFREGPFSSEAELREFVDLAEASRVIESGESKMIHSVFELGDTIAREVMVPRTDMVFIERYKTLR